MADLDFARTLLALLVAVNTPGQLDFEVRVQGVAVRAKNIAPGTAPAGVLESVRWSRHVSLATPPVCGLSIDDLGVAVEWFDRARDDG